MDQEPWLAILSLLGMLLVLAFGLVGLSGSVWLMIWPVERRARATREKFRFRLIDLGCLLVYWQVILAILGAIGRTQFESAVGLIVCASTGYFLVSGGTWCACVSVLSRAGIESSGRRAAFILISIPGAIAAAVTFVISGMATLMNAYHAVAEPPSAGSAWLPLALFAASVAAVFLLRLLSLWIAADARTA